MEKEKYTKEELKALGIILSLKGIDKKKIDLSIKPAHICIVSNLCKQFNIPYPKSLPKRIYVGDIEWTNKCQEEFEGIMKKKIKTAYCSNQNYSWFRLQFYPANSDWKNKINPVKE